MTATAEEDLDVIVQVETSLHYGALNIRISAT